MSVDLTLLFLQSSATSVRQSGQSEFSTSEPLGVVFDGPQGRALPQAAVDDGINGQEVCHCGGEEAAL